MPLYIDPHLKLFNLTESEIDTSKHSRYDTDNTISFVIQEFRK